jgi:pSer/pThr/pTyr-binding forkhead associated (FHA) protein
VVLSLATASTEDTIVVESSELRTVPTPQKKWRSADVGQDHTVDLQINGATCTITIPQDDSLILGRGGSYDGPEPDVNLSEYDAVEQGVSRLHAALRLQGDMLMIKDMGSTNGTYVNGQRVRSQWRTVRHLDEIRLGRLTMTLQFQDDNHSKDDFLANLP